MLEAEQSDLGGYKDVTVAVKAGRRRAGRGAVRPAEVRGGRAPGAARARHRVAGTHPHQRGRGPRAARDRGRRGRDRPERPAHRRFPVQRAGRPERQHHRLGRAHHPPAHGHRRELPEREEPAAEQGVGPAHPASPARRRGRGGRREGGLGRPALAGAHGRPQRADPHLQLPREPHQRPPHGLQGLQPRCRPRRRDRGARAGVRRRRQRRADRALGRSSSPAGQPTVRTLRDVLVDAERRLDRAGVPTPRVDAELLLAHVLGVPRGRIFLSDPADPADGPVRGAARPPSARVPLQHLLGEAPFRHLVLEVGRGVFVPRPETEGVAELAIRALSEDPVERMAVDLCTGTGAIALSVATEVPHSVVHAVELEGPAYGWADRNVARYADGSPRPVAGGAAPGRRDRAHVDPLRPVGRVDVVVTNPPYIPDDAVPRDPEVREYDPPRALYGGPDGLDVVRGIAVAAAALLRPGGVLVVEHGDDQGESAGAAECRTCCARRGATDVATSRPRGARPRERRGPGVSGRQRWGAAAGRRCGRIGDREPPIRHLRPRERETGLEAATSAARRGDLVVLPTDTVYGVGCDAFSLAGVSGCSRPRAVAATCPSRARGGRRPSRAWHTGCPRRRATSSRRAGPARSPSSCVTSRAWRGTSATRAARWPADAAAPGRHRAARHTGPPAVTSANVAGAARATDFLGAEEQLGDTVAIYLDAGTCPTPRPARSWTCPDP